MEPSFIRELKGKWVWITHSDIPAFDPDYMVSHVVELVSVTDLYREALMAQTGGDPTANEKFGLALEKHLFVENKYKNYPLQKQ